MANNKKNKGQEEIVGFVAIVLLVAVVALIFLGISLRKPVDIQKESKDVSRFLESTMLYTTDCAFGYEPNYVTPKDLMKECYLNKGKKCLNDEEVCLVLNDTLKGILDNSWKVGEDSAIKGYSYNSTYSRNSTKGEVESIISLGKGNCTSSSFVTGETFFAVYPGTITSSLKLCY